jgi:carbamoyltransferase
MYQLATLFAGFGDFQEGKTHGPGALGSPLLSEQWCAAVRHPAPLAYEIDPTYQTFDIRGRKVPADFIKLFGQPRHHSEELRRSIWTWPLPCNDVGRDSGDAGVRSAESDGCTNLVLAGGVALNSVANQQIVERAGFDNVFIVPCAADDGTALGAALWPWYEAGNERSGRWPIPTWAGLIHAKNTRRRSPGTTRCSNGSITPTRCPGKSPNALPPARWSVGTRAGGDRSARVGQRSIFCDPRRAANKDLLNEKVKFAKRSVPSRPSRCWKRRRGTSH